MQINPMCEELRGGYVKEGTISGTTDGNGNLIIARNYEKRMVVGTSISSSSLIGQPFVYENENVYVHVTQISGWTSAANKAVTGKYYYIDL